MKNSFIKVLRFFKTLNWAIHQLLIAAPFETAGLFLFITLQGLIPAASLFAIQGIIDWIAHETLFPVFLISLWGGLLLADIVMSPVIGIIRLHLNQKMLVHCNLLIMEKANSINGLHVFENPLLYDEIQFLKSESSKKPLNFVYIITDFVKDSISLVSIAFLLGSIEWWIPLAIFITNLPFALSTLWFEKQSWEQMLFHNPDSRKMAWLSSLLLDVQVAKEVRLFKFGHFLIERYKKTMRASYRKIARERWKKSTILILLSSITVIGDIAIISAILWKAKNGEINVASLIIIIQALVMTQAQLIGCIAGLGMSLPVVLFFDKLRLFLNKTVCNVTVQKTTSHSLFSTTIRFENVSFQYADGRQALSSINLIIKKGERLAIVGENGSGKSTLIKLLMRFYDPTEGMITVDGRDLKDIDLDYWRSQISGVFQDFGQYHFTVKENIALGDLNSSEISIAEAAQKGGFFPILDKLPERLNALLGKEYGGTSLSGGEWQRLAMSRAFIRKADILILDEPTAALDPKSEEEIFRTFSNQSFEKTTLLVTHRLGSVKKADRIILFKEGRIVEEGTHQDLLSLKQEYACLYNLQADQFQ